ALASTVQTRRVALARAVLNPALLRRSISDQRQCVAGLSDRLAPAFMRATVAHRERLNALDRLRETLGYKATLERGYAVVRADGAVATRKSHIKAGAALEIEFADGRHAVEARKPARKKSDGSAQGSLF
ncbi:MAG: exodeoxyribonuclease VII large subunit, partial [Pseudomonadota bacterium]